MLCRASLYQPSLRTKDSSPRIQPTAIIKQGSYPIASGGLGDVYKCTWIRDAGPDEVAVKSPRFPDVSSDQVAKINKSIDREARIWAILEHEYILPFYGTVEGFGRFRALVFPWMPNGNLNTYLNRTGVTLATLNTRLCILKQITEGLKYLHDNSVIHGDLTSNNVLITANGSPRLADFGISNIIMQANPTYSFHTGAVRWVAPELMTVLEDQIVPCGTKSSDIYALGGIMLQVLYGKHPYWWIKNAIHVVTAKFKHMEPINSSIMMQPDHLDFMRRCWSADGKARPSVDDVLTFLLQCEASLVSRPRQQPHDAESDSQPPVAPDAMLPDLTKFITKIGEYAVAGGGFGDIWKCIYKTDLGSTNVAVKTLRVYASDEDEAMKKKSKRIQHELKICAKVTHSNILPVLGYTSAFGPLMAIVNPWAENGNLTTYLEREDASVPVVRRFHMLRDIAAGLQHLHTHCIIHGDLTGLNVLIHGDGRACLTDFGLSLMYSEVIGITQASWTSTFHGNPRWLAPELLGESEDDVPVRPRKWTDIYSFGNIMLNVLTSKVPYYYIRAAAASQYIGAGKKPDRSRYPTFSNDYWHFIEECWSDAPGDRPSADRVVEVIKDELDLLSSSNAA